MVSGRISLLCDSVLTFDLKWYHAARNEQNKLEIYVLVAKSPAFIYAPVLHASQTTTAFLEMFCLDQYKYGSLY